MPETASSWPTVERWKDACHFNFDEDTLVGGYNAISNPGDPREYVRMAFELELAHGVDVLRKYDLAALTWIAKGALERNGLPEKEDLIEMLLGILLARLRGPKKVPVDAQRLPLPLLDQEQEYTGRAIVSILADQGIPLVDGEQMITDTFMSLIRKRVAVIFRKIEAIAKANEWPREIRDKIMTQEMAKGGFYMASDDIGSLSANKDNKKGETREVMSKRTSWEQHRATSGRRNTGSRSHPRPQGIHSFR